MGDAADIARLRAKYLAVKAAAGAGAPVALPSAAGKSAVEAVEAAEGVEADGAASLLRMCGVCQGLGIETVMYNHMRMQRNCEGCAGHGLVPREPGLSIDDRGRVMTAEGEVVGSAVGSAVGKGGPGAALAAGSDDDGPPPLE